MRSDHQRSTASAERAQSKEEGGAGDAKAAGEYVRTLAAFTGWTVLIRKQCDSSTSAKLKRGDRTEQEDASEGATAKQK